MDKIEDLLHELIEATYITGWNSGAIESGRKDLLPIQQEGITKRIAAKEKLILKVDALVDTLRREVERLTAENATLREAARWIPVTERLPENEDRVLGVSFFGYVDFAHYRADDTQWYWSVNYPTRPVVTHWRPLPEPPEVEK